MSFLYNFKFDASDIETFINNFVLGLPRALNSAMGVEDVTVVFSEGMTLKTIEEWQTEMDYPLPLDLVKFYNMMNGFYLSWGYRTKKQAILKVGLIKIEPLYELIPLAVGAELSEFFEALNLVSDEKSPKFNSRSIKVLQLDCTRDNTLICLVYSEVTKSHTIWLLDRSLQWHFIADSFLKYFNTMVHCGGLPQWHLRLTTFGVAMWAEQLLFTFNLCLRRHQPATAPSADTWWQVDKAGSKACYKNLANDTSAVKFKKTKSIRYPISPPHQTAPSEHEGEEKHVTIPSAKKLSVDQLLSKYKHYPLANEA